MDEKKDEPKEPKNTRLTKKRKELINFSILCCLLLLGWYEVLTTQSILWVVVVMVYLAWVLLSGIKIWNMEKYKDLPPNERFQAEIITGRQTVFPDIHKMKSFVMIDDAEEWAKKTAESNESWRVIDLTTGREIRKPKQG